jgi:hypothetical protein
LPDAGRPALAESLRVAAERIIPPLERKTVVYHAIDAVLGPRATHRIATSALPCAPVLPAPEQRHLARRLLRGMLPRRSGPGEQ